MGSYEVVLGQGQLGLELGPTPPALGSTGAEVVSVQGAAAAAGRIAPGHILSAVNGRSVRVALNQQSSPRMNFQATMAILQSAERPATLRFEIPRSHGGRSSAHYGDEYRVTFTDQFLGLRLSERDPDASAAVMSLSGAAASCGQIAVGDTVVAVNDTSTSTLPFRKTKSLVNSK